MSLIEPVRPAEDAVSSTDIELAALNALAVTVTQLVRARDRFAGLADDLRWNTHARRAALAADVPERLAAAIETRLCALRKWEDLHDAERGIAQGSLMDAAAIANLVATDHGIGFDGVGFGELLEFIAELPW